MISGVPKDAIQQRTLRENLVGASLLAMASGQTTMDQLGFFEIRNALALASTTRYITSVINNGSKK